MWGLSPGLTRGGGEGDVMVVRGGRCEKHVLWKKSVKHLSKRERKVMPAKSPNV